MDPKCERLCEPQDAHPAPDTTTTLLRALASSGAPDAQWARFVRLYDPVCRFYLAVLRRGWTALNRDWDNDIVQETMLAIVQTLPSGKWDPGRGRFRDFLFGIVRNKAREFARREVRAASAPERLAEEMPPEDGPCDGAEEEREALRVALWRQLVDRVFAESRMSEASKKAFLRLVEDEVPVARLSAETGMTPNAIYRLKNRMTEKLRAAWLSSGGDPSDPADALEAIAKRIL